MEANFHSIALITAGTIGSCVAVVHGLLTQRYMVRPWTKMAREKNVSNSIIRMIPALLHFSTVAWLSGGLALVATSVWAGPSAKLTTAVLVGGSYLFGVIGNCWATRGRHPGWMLLAIAVALIAFGATSDQ